jgi:hypothetical protein
VKRPPPGKCVHCLRHFDKLTWDHVFPKAWYPDTTPQYLYKWQIPSCGKCNGEYGRLEGNLLLRLGLCIDPNEPRSLGVVPKALRAIDPRYGKSLRDKQLRMAKRKKILRELAKAYQVHKQAIYPGFEEKWNRPLEEQSAILLPAKSLQKLTEKIVRGIFFIEDQRFIEPSYGIQFFALTNQDARPMVDIVNRFGTTYAREPGIVVDRAVTPGDRTSSVFRIVIWGRLQMYAAVLNMALERMDDF